MFRLMTTAAVAALLAADPAVSQTAGTGADAAAAEDVYRNDLPETHGGFGLPEIGAGGASALDREGGGAGALETVAAGAVTAQQFGNLAASKHASGVARDLGDVMILLHSEINERLDGLGEDDETAAGLPQDIPESDQQALNALRDLNDREFNAGFAAWVAEAYPDVIAAWRQLGDAEGFAELAGAVVPHLEDQLAVAEQIVMAEGDLQQVDDDLAAVLAAAGAGERAADNADPTGTDPTGAEGQTGERQHTPEPEQPEVQTGENYAHQQVETEADVRTQAMPEAGGSPVIPAGEPDIINAAGLFSALENPEIEIEQLRGASGLGATGSGSCPRNSCSSRPRPVPSKGRSPSARPRSASFARRWRRTRRSAARSSRPARRWTK